MTPNLNEEKEEITVTAVNAKPAAPAVTSTTRARVSSRKVKSGMFDTPETVAVAISGLVLLSIILSYFFVLQPARDEAKAREKQRAELQTQLSDLQKNAEKTKTDAQGTVDLVSSVDRFEAAHMPSAVQGNAALYQRLNELIRANGLRNTTGPEYAPLETIPVGGKSSTKQQSVFPGTYVTVTVEGGYGNLRRFITDLETTRQFLVINSVEIESNETGGSGSNPAGGGNIPNNSVQPNSGIPNSNPMMQPNPNSINPRLPAQPDILPNNVPSANENQRKRGAVSLRLELAAYFRRASGQPNVQRGSF